MRLLSGNYVDRAINQIPIPILALMSHAVRPDRLAWLNGQAGPDNGLFTTETVVDAANPWVAGLGTTYFQYPTGSGDTRSTLATSAGDGHVVTMLDTGGAGTVGIAYWDTGSTFYAGSPGGTAGAERVWFPCTNWAKYTGSYQDNFDNLTADGKTALGRVIGSLVPEPMTLALLGLGAAATLLSRRRR